MKHLPSKTPKPSAPSSWQAPISLSWLIMLAIMMVSLICLLIALWLSQRENHGMALSWLGIAAVVFIIGLIAGISHQKTDDKQGDTTPSSQLKHSAPTPITPKPRPDDAHAVAHSSPSADVPRATETLSDSPSETPLDTP